MGEKKPHFYESQVAGIFLVLILHVFVHVLGRKSYFSLNKLVTGLITYTHRINIVETIFCFVVLLMQFPSNVISCITSNFVLNLYNQSNQSIMLKK